MNEKIIQISAGNGPSECCWVVAKVLKILLRKAKQGNINCHVIEKRNGPENGTIKTVILKLSGKEVNEFTNQWQGTIQWVGQSRFRKLHKRKNWFIGVFNLNKPEVQHNINLKDIKYNFVRSGGPGGQHVNKVNTKVIATHLPTGMKVAVSIERSQYRNKLNATKQLMEKIEQLQSTAFEASLKEQWVNHQALDRGNPVRVFKGEDFKPNHKPIKYKHRRKRAKQNLMKEINE